MTLGMIRQFFRKYKNVVITFDEDIDGTPLRMFVFGDYDNIYAYYNSTFRTFTQFVTDIYNKLSDFEDSEMYFLINEHLLGIENINFNEYPHLKKNYEMRKPKYEKTYNNIIKQGNERQSYYCE